MIDPKLENKTALITGANHGIGKATALSLARQGANIFVTGYIPESLFPQKDLNEAKDVGAGGELLYAAMQQEPLEHTVNELGGMDVRATGVECDLSDPDAPELLFDTCERELGHVDILINNHTYCVPETFDSSIAASGDFDAILTNAESIDRHFAVNARASALMMKEFLDRHIDRKATQGRIINLTTVLGHTLNVSYAASKRALVSYSMSAAQEMGKYGITVNVVCPGATQTGYITPESESWITKQTPLGRLGTPQDVADVITFLASEQAGWLTGQLIYASGGFLMYLNE